MLQEPADDRFDADVRRHSGDAGPEATNSADHELDRNARLARLIKLIDYLAVDQAVDLGPHRGRLALPRIRDFRVDQGEDLLAQTLRAQRKQLQALGPHIAGREVEQLGSIAGRAT